ncbi:MAG: YkgJ family cysteine cluster protein [Lentisphaerae bacterium]|nr:MAG: YkgJ family cysteine cluster protein [Lentisphaerota bacterium]
MAQVQSPESEMTSTVTGTVYLCTRCSSCCKWSGVVRLTDPEITAISRFLQIDEDEFIQKYTDLLPNRSGLTLIELENGHCIFIDAGSGNCRIYPVRPMQCRRFPNGWNFPGFDKTCRSIAVHYRLTHPCQHESPYPPEFFADQPEGD